MLTVMRYTHFSKEIRKMNLGNAVITISFPITFTSSSESGIPFFLIVGSATDLIRVFSISIASTSPSIAAFTNFSSEIFDLD